MEAHAPGWSMASEPKVDIAVVVVTHDARVSEIAHRILEIRDGKILGEASAASPQ